MTTKYISQAQYDNAELIRLCRVAVAAQSLEGLTLAQKIAYKRAVKTLDTAWREILEATPDASL